MLFVGTVGDPDDGHGSGPRSAAAAPMLHDASFLPPDGAVRDVALALLADYLAGVGAHVPGNRSPARTP
jgi:hypothetical protein